MSKSYCHIYLRSYPYTLKFKFGQVQLHTEYITHVEYYRNTIQIQSLPHRGLQIVPEHKPKERTNKYKLFLSTGKLENGSGKDDSVKQNGRSTNSEKEEAKLAAETLANQKKAKAERKQRLQVRSDDAVDLYFKFDDYGKERNYKDEPDKRDDGQDRLSEDGEVDHDAGRSSTNPSPTPSHTNAGGFRSARRKVSHNYCTFGSICYEGGQVLIIAF